MGGGGYDFSVGFPFSLQPSHKVLSLRKERIVGFGMVLVVLPVPTTEDINISENTSTYLPTLRITYALVSTVGVRLSSS